MVKKVDFLADGHRIQKVSPDVRERLSHAQQNILPREFRSAAELCRRACESTGVDSRLSEAIKNKDVNAFSRLQRAALVAELREAAIKVKLPAEAVPQVADLVADRVQLLVAFETPDEVVEIVASKVAEVVGDFPKNIESLEQGKNPGDVLDPFIIAATQELMHGGDMNGALQTITAHKAMMMIEGLVGHLHEDVIGRMRGNVRVPEPRGVDQEALDPVTNPFPGADVVQPPLGIGACLKFHQVKSKTGSAKGGDGKRLGQQLKLLSRTYSAEVYYDALIGRSLSGHRSMAGVLKACPSAIVLVGKSAFSALTGNPNGAELLLRVYQSAFRRVAQNAGYNVKIVAAGIAAAFRRRAEAEGDDYLEVLLRDVTGGSPETQDSRTYLRGSRRRNS